MFVMANMLLYMSIGSLINTNWNSNIDLIQIQNLISLKSIFRYIKFIKSILNHCERMRFNNTRTFSEKKLLLNILKKSLSLTTDDSSCILNGFFLRMKFEYEKLYNR